jgi:hypothetical protein
MSPVEHWSAIRSNNAPEHRNKELRRRPPVHVDRLDARMRLITNEQEALPQLETAA